MFGGSRRHRPPVQPLTKETANPNAATAAASAFMRREGSTSLSSAAAAAALRARPTTPTNVAEVQTKRTARRSPSVSSIGSRDAGRRSLQRSPSVGSMSERSFRSPSPGRGPPAQHQNVPPVPKLPTESHAAAATRATGNSAGRKGLSLQTQPFRTASQKMKDGQSGSWFAGATARNPANVRKSDSVLHSSFTSPDVRPTSPSSSINFSYPRPRSSSIDSHTTPSPIADNAMVYDPNSRRMVPKVDLFERQNTVREASEKPVKKKKTQEVSRSGSHLAKGTVGRTKAPVLETVTSDAIKQTAEPESRTAAQDLVPESADVEKDANATVEQATESRQLVHRTSSPESSHATTVLPPSTATLEPVTGHSGIAPARDASPDPAEKSFREDADTVTPVPDQSNTPPTDTRYTSVADDTMEDKGLAEEKPDTVSTRQPSSIRRERVHSESPARTAHFAPATDQLLVRHEPPSRSLSPRKSALKQRSPTRGASPSDDSSEASGSGLGASLRDDTPLSRKKSARVSFDDQNTVVVGEAAPIVGETDSPIVPSPQAQTKKPWHSIVGKHTRKEHASLDEDETMTPRPALPLFGSVREKKVKEPEERPLVRPTERNWSPSPVSPAQRQPSPFNSPAPHLPQPTDYNAEPSSVSEQPRKHEANISKYREPLPPVVTSVEGSGYISNSAESSDNENEDEVRDSRSDTVNPEPRVSSGFEEAVPGEAMGQSKASEPDHATTEAVIPTDTYQNNPAAYSHATSTMERPVPDISISLPSPTPQPDSIPSITPQQEYFDVPGGFPEDDNTEQPTSSDLHYKSDSVAAPASSAINDRDNFSTSPDPAAPSLAGVSAPELDQDIATSHAAHGSPMADIREEDEMTDSSNNSIYSDAYEDLSDVDGDGFMSLDAVVTAPVPKKSFENATNKSSTKPDHITSTATTPLGTTRAPIEKPSHAPDNWENAKAYWRSLTTEKRRQLEVEAMVDGDDEADAETELKPKKSQQKVANGSPTGTEPQQANGHSRSYQIQPGTKWPSNGSASVSPEKPGVTHSRAQSDRGNSMKLRKSMRQQEPVFSSSPQQGTMRKSLRSGGSGSSASMNTQAQNNAATGSPSKPSGRPISYQPPSTAELSKRTMRNSPADRQPSQPDPFEGSVRPSPRRRDSDASESSFTRTRATLGEGFGFKRTMRSSMYEPTATKPSPEHTKGSSRFSLRSLSPTGSAFRRSSMASSPAPTPGGRIRHSLRAESTENNASRVRIPTFSKATGKKAKSKLDGSRFDDSSDEEGGTAVFNSRFADSSDEDDAPKPVAKGQGLPKTLRNKPSSSAAAAAMNVPAVQRQDTNSPDLPDSDDEEFVQPKTRTTNGVANGKPNTTIQRSGSGRGHMVAANHTAVSEVQAETPIRPTQSRRGSFMSTILRRKKGPAGKISKGHIESAARRDTPLERSTEELSMLRTGSNGKPRLQRRGPSWPFPEEAGQSNAATAAALSSNIRPSTAGGPTGSSPKTNYLRRRSASYNGPAAAAAAAAATPTSAPAAAPVLEEDGPVEAAEPHKKKKFGTLRKMFRLHD
ncbi:hypothetical protein HJFPF1_04913 [Paramyrothecium foliicola]|nr:hypothetical protein HJFPF1_04913 [Paramyrothecium foliicola]